VTLLQDIVYIKPGDINRRIEMWEEQNSTAATKMRQSSGATSKSP
jgi:hypothetical protein